MIIRNLPKKKEKVVGTWFYILYNCDTEVWYFGQTKESRKDKRHTDPDYTKVIGEWELQGYKYKTHWIGIEQTGHHLDKKIHRPLRLISGMDHNDSGHGSNEVFRQKKWTEERVVSTCVELVHQVFGNADREAVYRKLYKHQDDFVEKILLYWENTDDEELEFLLFAKCRAGKSTMVLEVIRKSGDKVTLIVARQKSPESSWKGDVLLKNFENFVYINLADKDAKERIEKYLKTDKQIILWSTVQGVKKWKDIPCVVDHIVYDEADVGYNKGQWNDLRKTHPCKITYVSGTAFDLVYDFDDDNRFCYSYFEEQLDKKLGLSQDRHIPTLHIRTANYDTPEMRKYFGDDPDAFDNMFNTKDGEQVFVHPHLPAQYADDRFRNQRRLRPDEQYISGDIENIMFTVKDCDAAVAFGETMKATRFDPLVATSKQNITPEDINDHLDSEGCKCVITRTANVRGGTYKSVDAVFNLAKGTSKTFYWQFAFRGGSTDKDKWYLYDESPERVFSYFNELLLAAQDVNPELRNYTLKDFINASDFADGYKEWEQEEVEEKLICDVTNIKYTAENFVNGMNKEVLHNIACSTNLASTPTTFSKDVINQNDTNNKSNKQLIPADGFKTKEQEEEEKSKTEKQVREYMKRLPLAVRNAVLDNTFSGSADKFINSKHYIYSTGDSDGVLKEYLEKTDGKEKKRFVHRLNKIFNFIKHAINKNKGSELLDKLSHSRKEQQHIPLDLLDEMLSEIPIHGKIIIIGDPSGLSSLRAIEYGWKPEDITVWENDPCHTYSIKQVNNKITIIEDYETTLKPLEDFLMKFDAVLTNPPYQSKDANGKLRSSGTSPLWFKIVKVSKKLVKEDGWLSFITPSNIFFGGDDFSELFLGKKRELDLKKIFTNMKQKHFSKIGQDITRWLAQNSITSNNKAIFNDKMEIDTEKTLKVFDDDNIEIQEIFQTLMSYDGEKFELNVSGAADARGVSNLVKNTMGMSKKEADKYARDWSDVQSEEYPYAINSNNKIKYGKVKWKNYGQWKMMIPIMTSPFKYEIMVSDVVICDQSCNVQFFDNKEDALRAKEILDDPLYKWVLEQTRVSSRMCAAILSKLPVESIRNILTSKQISYIESQL